MFGKGLEIMLDMMRQRLKFPMCKRFLPWHTSFLKIVITHIEHIMQKQMVKIKW